MCEVTSSNFATLLPRIIEQIERSCFLAIDTEFSSLTTIFPSTDRISETIKQLYERRHRLVQQLTIFQFGLAIFSKVSSYQQRYIVHIYNFYLNPTSIDPIDITYVIQASSIKFLTQYKFDFNKCFYSGIPFLNRTQEQMLVEQLNNPNSNHRFPIHEQTSLRTFFEKINTWLITAQIGDTIRYDCVEIVDDYLLHTELRRCFKTIWSRTDYEMDKKKFLIIEHITRETYDQRIKDTNWQNDPAFISFIEPLIGFTRLVRHIQNNYRKPIVGHNCFLDWLIIYEKFLDSLPHSFEQFQTMINTHFSSLTIFDTKYLAFEMKDLLFSRRNRSIATDDDSSGHTGSNYVENFTSATSLSSLYELLTSKFYDNAIFFKPSIEFGGDGSDRYKDTDWKHEAGYDAYMSGVVFLKLLYFYKQKKSTVAAENSTSSIYSNHSSLLMSNNLTFDICLNEMNSFKNRLHAINSSSIIPYVSLNKYDTYIYNREQLQRILFRSSNSCCLVVQARDGRQLDISDIISRFNAYCSMQYNIDSKSTRVFLTFKSTHCQTIILNDYLNHSLYKVEQFNRFKHSLLMQCCCCTVGTSIVLAVMIFFLVKRRITM